MGISTRLGAANGALCRIVPSAPGCHSVARIQTKKADEDEWSVIVDRMKGKGAELSDEETRALVEYLAKTYK